MEAVDILCEGVKYLAPPPPLTCSQWADEYRHVASGPFPGRWSTDRTPYLREPIDCVTDPSVEQIVIMKPTRVGATEGVINNAIGYHIHYDPCQILYVQTSLDEGRKYSNEILNPLIDVTQVLRERVTRTRVKKSRQTQLHKTFPGGNLAIVGAKSPKGFRMVSKRIVILDDIDGYEQNKEGDVITLAMGRAKDYWNKKIILVSNPTTEGVSRIHTAFLASDQRYRHVPCPHCGAFQVLQFGGKDYDYGIKWDDKGETFYLCEHCHEKIFEYQKVEMDIHGEYRAEAAFHGIAGFHLNPFLCAWHPWADIRKEFLTSKADPYRLIVFVNQWLGEVWKDRRDDKLDEHVLYARREVYPAEVPAGALILTGAVDVQDHRLEIEIRGWGAGEESWIIEHKIINGRILEENVQRVLDDYLLRTWRHESGVLMGTARVCIDTGGHYTSQVYAFCKDREGRGVYAIKGSNNTRADVLDGQLVRKKDAIYQMVGVTACKDIFFGRLGLTEYGAGYIHLPMSIDAEYTRQCFGEKLRIFKNTRAYEPVPGRRNEAIDLHNYNLAALRMYNPDWEELRRRGIGGMDRTRLVYKHHAKDKHLDDNIIVKLDLPIIVCCDFGKNPLTWMLCQTDKKRVWVFDEIALRNETTMGMAVEILKRYGNHKAGFIVYGSAVGTIRASTGKSEYAILRDMGFQRQVVKQANPPDIDRVNAINNMLEDISGQARLTYHSRCTFLRKDFEQALWTEDMRDIDRTDFGRGNATDALGYFIVYEWPLRSIAANPTRRFYK